MRRRRYSNRKIALERIHRLFQLALKVYHEEFELAQRYVNLARRIGMRYKVRIPREYRRLLCRHCKKFIIPGVNCRIRTKSIGTPHIVITCFECGGHMRIPLLKKRNGDRL